MVGITPPLPANNPSSDTTTDRLESANNVEKNIALSRQTGLTNIASEIDLRGKTVLVTGASVGIGKAIVEGAVRFGAKVVATDVREDGLAKLKQEFGDAVETVPFNFNTSDPNKWNVYGAQLREKLGSKLDVVMLNAGVVKMHPMSKANTLANTPLDEPEGLFRINTLANWALYQQLGDLLKASDSPRIIATTSPIVGRDDPKTAAYAITKGANEALLQNVGAELKAEMQGKDNLIVAAIDPGRVQTFLRRDIYPAEPYAAQPLPEDIIEPYFRLASAKADPQWNGQVLITQNTVAGDVEAQGKKFKVSDRTSNGFKTVLASRPINGLGIKPKVEIAEVDTYSSRQLMGAFPAPVMDKDIGLEKIFPAPGKGLPSLPVARKDFLIAHDRDDNLVGEGVTFDAYHKILADNGVIVSAEDLAKDWSGKRYEFALKKFEEQYGITVGDALILDERERFQRAYENAVIAVQKEKQITFPHVTSTLKILTEAGIDQALVTNNSKAVVINGNKIAGLDIVFPEKQIYSGDLVKTMYPGESLENLLAQKKGFKPSPDIYLEAMKHNHVDPKNVVAIEDSPSGIKAAKAAGIKTIVGNLSALIQAGASETKLADHEAELKRLGATHIIRNYAELLQIVKEVAPEKAKDQLQRVIGNINAVKRGRSDQPDINAVMVVDEEGKIPENRGNIRALG